MDEILAIQKVEKLKNKRVIYLGNKADRQDCTGYLELIFDENCCGATCNVSFAFVSDQQRFVLSTEEVLEKIILGNSSDSCV